MAEEHENFHSVTILSKAVSSLSTIIKLDISDLSCKLCSEKPVDFPTLLSHLVDVHKMRYDQFYNNYFLIFKMTDENSHSCMHCDYKTPFFNSLLSHTHRLHNNRSIICDICGKSFPTTPNLKLHINRSHNGPRIKCKLCEETFTNFQMKRIHEAKVHKINEFKCVECDVTFPSPYMRKRHMTKDHNRVEYKCEICNMSFIWKNHMVKHVQSVHTKECLIPCDICGEKFDVRYMSTHMICHSNNKPFECTICKKSFPRKKTLKVHERSHNKIK